MTPTPTPLTRPGWLGPGRALIIAWLLCCLVMLARLDWPLDMVGFRDPDDALRLQQVRDLLAGQSWFDVSQYRINPPLGVPMHWSRIVDAPIALLILLAQPLLGPAGAEIFACLLAPLLLLGVLTATTYIAARRVGGTAVALVASLLLLITPSILIQFVPFRIDHHGWQIMLAMIAAAGLLDPRPRRGGMVAGAALACWLAISSEGLPYAALFIAVAALWQVRDPAHTPRFLLLTASLGAASLIVTLMTRGAVPLLAVQCDALTAPYLWPLLVLALVVPLAHRVTGDGVWVRRLALAAIGGGAAALTLLAVGGPCLSADPFQSIGPLAYRVWYMHVLEGRPIWEQSVSQMGVVLLPPLIGLACTLAAARAAGQDRAARDNWLVMALLLAGAGIVAIMVMRAVSVAHLFALPGLGWAMLRLFARAQASPHMLVRVPGSAAVALLSPIGLCMIWVGLAAATLPPEDEAPSDLRCAAGAALPQLQKLPPARLFAPLDLGPTILARTGHSVLGTAHHRNAAGIDGVIRGFMASPDAARTIIGRQFGGAGADYVVICNLAEIDYYATLAPHGLAAALQKGDVPEWLQPLSADNSSPRVYRVVGQAGAKVRATPLMQ